MGEAFAGAGAFTDGGAVLLTALDMPALAAPMGLVFSGSGLLGKSKPTGSKTITKRTP